MMATDPSSLVVPGAAGEGGVWCNGEESLRLTSLNADADAAVMLTGRFLQVGRRDPVPLIARHVPNTDRTAATQDVGLGEGWLTGLSVIASGGAPLYAHTYVRVDLIRGRGTAATVLQTLLQGPVSALTRRGWPGSPLEASIAGPGALRSITGTNPAAGAEVSETVPAGARWVLRALRVELVTDATVANREVALVLDDGTTVFAFVPSGAAHTASATIRYNFLDVGARQIAGVTNDYVLPIPTLTLLAGHRIRTVTTALQAGDNLGAPQLLVDEHLEAA